MARCTSLAAVRSAARNVLAGNTPWWQMLDPFHRHGCTSWLLLATAACIALAWRDLRRAAP
jgi:hypothetical protein